MFKEERMLPIMQEQFHVEFKSSHLILIVGGNPLPAYIAAKLLARPEAHIWLIYSGKSHENAEDEPSTKEAAQRLEEILYEDEEKCWTITPVPVSSSNNLLIEQAIQDELIPDLRGKKQIGFNYSGGTKPMSLHVYRTLEKILKTPICCSYLDPRKLMLRFDRQSEKQRPGVSILDTDYLREQVNLSLQQLTRLHGYAPPPPGLVPQGDPIEWYTSKDKPVIGELETAIAEIYSNPEAIVAWNAWLNKFSAQDKKEDVALPNHSDLATVVKAMESVCGGAENLTGSELAKRISINSHEKLKSCSKYFAGSWLEGYAASAFLRAAERFGIPEDAMGQNLLYALEEEGKKKDHKDYFELDAAAIYGYQLFAVSCTNSENDSGMVNGRRSGNIGHLFEVYIRARQLGGDEARIALVCRSDAPKALEMQFHHTWDPEGKVRVFGQEHLSQLENHFLNWFRTANHRMGGLA